MFFKKKKGGFSYYNWMGGYRLARTFFYVVVFECYTTLYDFWNISFYGHVTIKQQQLRTPSPNPRKKTKTQNGVIMGQEEQIMPQELPRSHQLQARNV